MNILLCAGPPVCCVVFTLRSQSTPLENLPPGPIPLPHFHSFAFLGLRFCVPICRMGGASVPLVKGWPNREKFVGRAFSSMGDSLPVPPDYIRIVLPSLVFGDSSICWFGLRKFCSAGLLLSLSGHSLTQATHTRSREEIVVINNTFVNTTAVNTI